MEALQSNAAALVSFMWSNACACVFVQVKAGGAQQSPYLEALQKAEEKAQLAGAGMWSKVRIYGACDVQYIV